MCDLGLFPKSCSDEPFLRAGLGLNFGQNRHNPLRNKTYTAGI